MLVMGLDLGKMTDPTALAILDSTGTTNSIELLVQRYSKLLGGYGMTTERKEWEGSPATHRVVHLERFPLGTTYPDIVDTVIALLTKIGECVLVVDAGGVGVPVIDLFWQKGVRPWSLLITGGNTVSSPGEYSVHVPKQHLVSTIGVGLQTERLQIAEALPLAQVLTRELAAFRMIKTEAGNNTFEARQGAHDDIVLAVAIAQWFADEAWAISPRWDVPKESARIGNY